MTSARKKRKVTEDTSIEINNPTGEELSSESQVMSLDELFTFCDEKIIVGSNDMVIGNGAPIHCYAVSNKPDPNLRWIERVGSYFAPTAACTYEIVYPNPSQKEVSFGFTLQWQRLPYSIRNPNRWLLYCTIASVNSDYSSIISKGDILLKVDDKCMFYQPGEAVDYDTLGSKLQGITSASAVVRILRPAAASANMTLSPIEIISYAVEKTATARFQAASKMSKDGSLRPTLENTAVEAQAPATVKRMMLGTKINWVTIPSFIREGTMDGRLALMKSVNAAATSNGMAPAPAQLLHPQAGVFVPMMSVNDVTSFDEQLFSDDTNGGLYRDKNRFVTIFVDNPPPSTSESGPLLSSNAKAIKRIFNLGRFDSEEEASRTYFRAVKVKEMYGSFEPRYYLKELARKPLPPPPAVVPASSLPPQAPQAIGHHHPVIPVQQASNYQKMMQHQQQIQRQTAVAGGQLHNIPAYPVYQQQQMNRTSTAPSSAGTYPTQQQMRQYQAAPTAGGIAPTFQHFPAQQQQAMHNQQLYRPNTMPAQQNYLQQPQQQQVHPTGFANTSFQQRIPQNYQQAQTQPHGQFTGIAPQQQSAIVAQQLQAHHHHPPLPQGQQQATRLPYNLQQANPQEYNLLLQQQQQQRYQQQQQQQLQLQQPKQYPNQGGAAGNAQGGSSGRS